MKLIFLILGLLAISSCQDVLVENWTGWYSYGQEVKRDFENPGSKEFDFAGYGWFRFNSTYKREYWASYFDLLVKNVTSPDKEKGYRQVLSLFTQGNKLETTYFSLAGGPDISNENPVIFNNEDVDKWTFFYIGYNSNQKKVHTYYRLPHSGELYTQIQKVTFFQFSHFRINVGKCNHRFFPGNLFRVILHTGPTSYRESEYDQFLYVNPNKLPECPIIFSGCAYSGNAIVACQKFPDLNVNAIKSIYLPKNFRMTVQDRKNYADCISNMNWENLVSQGQITLTIEKSIIRVKARRH